MKKRRNQNKLLAAALGTAFAALGTNAFASGFQLQEQNASGLGLAYSGMAAAVQDASTVFWNPAGTALLPGIQGAVSLNYIMPDTKYTDSGTSTFAAFGNDGNAGVDALVPALYGSWMINPQWSVGLGINAPFGLSTEWDLPWAGQFHALKSEIKTLNINPTVAFKVNNAIQLGAGLSYQRLEATLTNGASPLIPGSVGQVKGDDWGWGWNVGALFALGPDTRIGVTYRSTIKYEINADLTFSTPALAALAGTVKANIKLPDTFSVAVSHKLNPKIRLLADWTWTGWDTIQNLTLVRTSGPLAGTNASNTALNFKTSWRVGGGIEYEVSQPVLLRAGIAYDKSPVQDEFRTPRLPDNDRTWLSVGARFKPSPNWWFDVGYTYIWVNDGPSQLMPNTIPPGNLVGNYKSNINILGAQASFKF
ncbi:MAG: outer membrane protein transport protein [Betaproteobacteria bacterium]|jgi:long-chain fatty acid transport protein|nr:outer membrane protein transport protein [Betaproteobacteria bacterium]